MFSLTSPTYEAHAVWNIVFISSCFWTNSNCQARQTINFQNPETDSTVLFYIELNRGAPSYNMGELYGRVRVIGDTGTFYKKLEEIEDGCKWGFRFSKRYLSITTIDGQFGCGFGNAVYVDEVYTRKSDKVQDYFATVEGRRLNFKASGRKILIKIDVLYKP